MLNERLSKHTCSSTFSLFCSFFLEARTVFTDFKPTDFDLCLTSSFGASPITSSVTTLLGTGLRLTPQGVSLLGPLAATVLTVRLVTFLVPPPEIEPLVAPEVLLGGAPPPLELMLVYTANNHSLMLLHSQLKHERQVGKILPQKRTKICGRESLKNKC